MNSLPDRMKDYAAILAYLGSPEPNGLNIPVPKIKHVEPDASEVGLPWMLMDMIPGDLVVDTYRSWRQLSTPVREQRIVSFFSLELKQRPRVDCYLGLLNPGIGPCIWQDL